MVGACACSSQTGWRRLVEHASKPEIVPLRIGRQTRAVDDESRPAIGRIPDAAQVASLRTSRIVRRRVAIVVLVEPVISPFLTATEHVRNAESIVTISTHRPADQWLRTGAVLFHLVDDVVKLFDVVLTVDHRHRSNPQLAARTTHEQKSRERCHVTRATG